MRLFFVCLLFVSLQGFSQSPSYIIGVKGDTLNRVDAKGIKQGKWVNHVDELRGEPGYEEEGQYKDNRKEGTWRVYSLEGDLKGLEFYRWGNKDGICQYFSPSGALLREESWKALNPDKLYDTLVVEDVEHLNQYRTVIVKNEGAAIKHGIWKYYDPSTGMINRTQTYTMGKLETAKAPVVQDSTQVAEQKMVKPKEVQDYEKKNAGKKKIRVRTGQTN
ncbi:MAG: toxin-antitoxin system YwqK family antitoxin [Chitinophagales bacterium]